MRPVIRYLTLKETVEALLPSAEELSKRNVQLSHRKLEKLRRLKNWDTNDDTFVFFHAKTKEGRITRTLVTFREYIRQGGVLLMAVSLDNDGRILEVRLMEAPNFVIQWIQPILRSDYLDSFKGKDHRLDLELGPEYRDRFSGITQQFALKMANAVKKSAQLFMVEFYVK
ncbi:hypothetical protein [Nitrospina gracilis]|uniref:hypothetical protein n=1 Tax=Nitrospina gracilis TaxID=35801 RepID=UPI001F329BA5|nr:hypothetical protein [Nitrospina gracilis]